LLNKKNFCGVKTGLTPNAGACLIVLYDLLELNTNNNDNNNNNNNNNNNIDGHIVVVLLGARE
jgi:hypothetical protein